MAHCLKKKVAKAGAFLLLGSLMFTPYTQFAPAAQAVPAGADVYIFVGRNDGQRFSAKSNGNGTFGPLLLAVTHGKNLRGGASEDFDGDGDLDLVGCNANDNKCYLYPQASGAFSIGPSIHSIGLSTAENGMVANDFDQDGHADVVVGGNSALAAVLFGDGTGNFPPARVISNLPPASIGFPYLGKDSADIDGNGYPDIVIGEGGSGDVYSYLNSAGSFASATLLFNAGTTAPLGVAVADFDGDGFIDIIAGGGFDGEISLWKGDGTNSFVSVGLIDDFDAATGIDNYDFDGDGDQDLVAVKANGDVLYLESNGDGTFKTAVSLGTVGGSTLGGITTAPQPPIHSTVQGKAFSDPDENGVDNGDGAIAGAELVLTGTDYLGNGVNRSTTTAADGTFIFEDVVLDNGTAYILSAVPPVTPSTLYTATTSPVSRSVSIPQTNTTAVEDFGFLICTDADGDTFAIEGGACGPVDCDDTNPLLFPGADADNDGVEDCSADLCLGTAIPETDPTVELKPNHYMITDSGSLIFDVGDGSKSTIQEYTISDMLGCSCEQILDAAVSGSKEGLLKYGCTKGTFQSWISGNKDTCDFDGDGDDDCIQ